MKLIILTILAVAHAGVIEDKCDGVFIRNIYHDREILKDDFGTLGRPFQLSVDFDTQTLFFSIFPNTFSLSGGFIFKSAYIDLKTNEFGIILGINGGFANAIDNKNHVVYLGGKDGIYTFDFDSKNATHVAGNQSVWQMFYKDRLYYIDFPTKTAYYYEKGETKKVEELNFEMTAPMVMALDKDDNFLFSISSGLYKRENGAIIKLGGYKVTGFATDINGNLYFSTLAAMYSVNGQDVVKLVEIGENEINGMAIDGENNIIYANNGKLVKLTPSKKKCGGANKEITNTDV